MFVKFVGILLIIVGGWVALGTLFPLIGSALMLVVVAIKLLIALGIAYFGYRLITREQEF